MAGHIQAVLVRRVDEVHVDDFTDCGSLDTSSDLRLLVDYMSVTVVVHQSLSLVGVVFEAAVGRGWLRVVCRGVRRQSGAAAAVSVGGRVRRVVRRLVAVTMLGRPVATMVATAQSRSDWGAPMAVSGPPRMVPSGTDED